MYLSSNSVTTSSLRVTSINRVLLFFFFFPLWVAWGILIPYQVWNPGPQQWVCQVLTTVLPGNSPEVLFFFWKSFQKSNFLKFTFPASKESLYFTERHWGSMLGFASTFYFIIFPLWCYFLKCTKFFCTPPIKRQNLCFPLLNLNDFWLWRRRY